MAKTIKSKLKDGEMIIGELVDVNEKSVVLADKNGNETKLTVPENVAESIYDDFNSGDIVKITAKGDDHEIEGLDGFPNDKEKEKGG